MSLADVPPRDRLATWCGGWLALVFLLTPLLAWMAPLGFALLAGVAGLACLPAFKVQGRDRQVYLALLAGVVWAIGSTAWSPYRAPIWESSATKLCAEVVLYFSLVCAARRASPSTLALCARLLAWGTAALGLLMLVEALTGAGVYQALRIAMSDPIRPDLAEKNIAQALFVLALLIGPASLAARDAGGWWLTAPMAAGLLVGAHVFGYDAPALALAASALAGGMVWAWPRVGPRILAVGAGVFVMTMPALVQGLRASGLYTQAETAAPLSWAQRMGYWRHAADWISDHPLRGWGLDASRMFSPGIQLHPHDAALQIWLELGLIGAVAATAFWAALFLRLSRPARDPAVAVAAGSAVAYLVFGAVSFGVWQEWWLGLGALTAAAVTVALRGAEPAPADSHAPVTRRTSTAAPISE
jgi:O-antigen ligase